MPSSVKTRSLLPQLDLPAEVSILEERGARLVAARRDRCCERTGNYPPRRDRVGCVAETMLNYITSKRAFWLEPVALSANDGFVAVELNRVRALILKHLSRILEAWDEHCGG